VDTTQQRKRRRYTLAFKRQVLEETLAGDESVPQLSMLEGIDWRRPQRTDRPRHAAHEDRRAPGKGERAPDLARR
jgi:transposase-like protein